MNIRQTIIGNLTAVALVGLASCAPIQAKEGQIYEAGEGGAQVVTVEGMRRIIECEVPERTVAFTERETYFEISNGGSAPPTRVLLTEVAHTGPGCSAGGGYDFIAGNPEEANWTPLDPEKDFRKYEKAVDTLCDEGHLRETNPRLDEQCVSWGRGGKER